ncbi:hypothetical protein [Campylobacter fetus]|uniref:hypothetical protein n=1 Tax=Campylobacter fetus TaxID=196 RepID=UPI0008189C5B|nr:hypothetical protein [Campylobacter fetus]RUT50981.1 hypothetical protein BWK67_00210 [Campylobacter fetus]RUT51709.1 hypothetical protein BWK51_00210 [Campylobacter fetus]
MLDNNGMDNKSSGLNVIKSDSVKEVEEKDIYEWFSKVTKGKKKLVVTNEALDLINMSVTNPEFDGFKFIDTIITYQSALQNDRVSLEDYINAIRFCSFLETTNGNATEAYIKAFMYREFVKDRYLEDRNSEAYKQLTSAATRYRKNPLVINILTQAEVPLYLMFQGYRYKAVGVLVKEMNEARLSKDRITAADKLLTHLKPPENIKVELDIGIKQDNIVDQYEDMLSNMVKKQKELLTNGVSIEEVANIKHNYIETEVIE